MTGDVRKMLDTWEAEDAAKGERIAELEGKLAEARAEVESLHKIISDPAAVWINMLRGTIARPQGLIEAEARATTAEAALTAMTAERDELTAQLAGVLSVVCDAAGLADPKMADEMRAKIPARAKAMQDVVKMATLWGVEYQHTEGGSITTGLHAMNLSVLSRSLSEAVRTYNNIDKPEQEQEG